MSTSRSDESRTEATSMYGTHDHGTDENNVELLRRAREITEREMVRKAAKAGVGTATTATVLATFVYYAPSQQLAMFVPY